MVFATLNAAPFSTPSDWKLVTEFPSQPRIIPGRLVGDVTITTAICDLGSSAFIAIRGQYAAGIQHENVADFYNIGRDAMLKSMSADLIKEETITVGGHVGRRYVVEAKNRKKRAESWSILIGNESYQFMFGTKDSIENIDAAEFFKKIRSNKSL